MDIVTTLLDVAQKGGAALAPFLILLWWWERNERKASTAALTAALTLGKDEAVKLATEATAAIKDTGNAVERIAEGAGESRASLAKVAEAITILSGRNRNSRG